MSRSDFFLNDTYVTTKNILRKEPELAENPNALVVKVWQAYGLKLKRKQRVPVMLLPEIADILDSAERAKKDFKKHPDLLEHSVLDDHKLEYEVEPKPKPPKVTKIKVKGLGRGRR